ncbi:MAG: ATP-binding protein [Rhodobacteraceae bacterium]|nr:ATP-binding protein [Paracoccaceae bacterium]
MILALLAALVGALLSQRATVLDQQASYGHAIIEHAWSLAELQIETKNLIARLHGYAAGSVPIGDVQLAFDILWSRIAALQFAEVVQMEGLGALKADYTAFLERTDAVLYAADPLTPGAARALVPELDGLSANTRRLWSNEFNQNRADFLGQLGGASHSATRNFDFLIGLVLLAGLSYLALELGLAERARLRESELLEAANSASELKTSFLANMSHEVRTPLNGVIGASELLLATRLDADQTELAQTISVSASHLLGVVNQVLDLTKIEAGRMDLELRDLSPGDLVREVVAMFARTAEDKGIVLRTVVSDDLPGIVRGDPLRLRQILANLVSNAVKFTERGEVVLEARTEPGRGGERWLGFAVRDTGIGIDRKALARVTEPFVQSDVSHSRRFGGTGLGLTISRQLIEMMEGVLQMDSQPGQGTTVTVRLPLPSVEATVPRPADATAAGPAPGTGPDPEATPTDPVPADAAGLGVPAPVPGAHVSPGAAVAGSGPDPHAVYPMRVLVAEDNATNLMLIRRMIGPSVTDLIVAPNGRVAVERWREGGVDLIFMDIQMPEMSGVEATALIRAEEAEQGTGPVPIWSMSANAMPHQRVHYVGVGMTGNLSKPFRKAELLEVVMRHAPRPPLRTAV